MRKLKFKTVCHYAVHCSPNNNVYFEFNYFISVVLLNDCNMIATQAIAKRLKGIYEFTTKLVELLKTKFSCIWYLFL